MKTQFSSEAHVYTVDDKDVGEIERVVIDPISKEVTHVVVRQGWLFTEDKVIPVELFQSAGADRAVLRSDIKDLDNLPHFEETHYVPLNMTEEEMREVEDVEAGIVGGSYWYPPAGAGVGAYYAPGFYGATAYPAVDAHPQARPGHRYVKRTDQNIPEDTVALEEGAEVYSVDGEHVGNIESIEIDTEANQATHIVISQGLFFKERKLVPTLWFKSVEGNKVHLAVKASLLEQLPAFERA